MIVVKIHSPLLSLQALVPTSSPLRPPACGAPGTTPLESPSLNIITEDESRIETRAVSHSRAARSGLPAGRDNGRLKSETARRGARFELSYDLQGRQVQGQNEIEKDKKRYEV